MFCPLKGTKIKVLKMNSKSRKNNRKRDDVATVVAKMYGVSENYVQKVRRGDRDDEDVLTTIMDIIEGRTKLIEEVEKLVPLERKTDKRRPKKLGDFK